MESTLNESTKKEFVTKEEIFNFAINALKEFEKLGEFRDTEALNNSNYDPGVAVILVTKCQTIFNALADAADYCDPEGRSIGKYNK